MAKLVETNEHVTLAGSGIGKILFAAVLCLDVKIYGNENEQGSAGTDK